MTARLTPTGSQAYQPQATQSQIALRRRASSRIAVQSYRIKLYRRRYEELDCRLLDTDRLVLTAMPEYSKLRSRIIRQ